MSGHITVITGGMFSEKSEELIKRCEKFTQFGKKNVKVYKPSGDCRFSEEEVVSRMGYRFPATNIPERLSDDWLAMILDDASHYDVIGFDEVQFFSKNIMSLVEELAYRGKKVIVSGLNMDFKGKEFGYIGGLLAMAEEMIRLYSFCSICGSDEGTHTQRLVNGKPAKKNDPIVLIGDTESYEARCRDCFVPPCRLE